MKFFRKHKYPFITDKRERFAVQTAILTFGLLITQLIWEDYRFFMVTVLSFLSYILTAWVLYEDIKGWEWLNLFILPVFFTASVSLYYFLLPARWISRVMTASLFAIGTYAILLIENIYNVAAARSIQLLRVAQSVGLLITLVVFFFSSNIVHSLRLPFVPNAFILSGISFILAFQSLWSINLEMKPTRKIILYTAVVAASIGQGTLALSFWPVESATYSLLIAGSFYVLIGIIQHYFSERLFLDTIREHFIFYFLLIFLPTLLLTRWGQ